MFLAASCTLLTIFYSDPNLSIHGVKVAFTNPKLPVSKLRHDSRYNVDVADLSSFRIHANLTDLFHWNTKQVFLSLTAEYQTKNHVKKLFF
jgi:hypothetical protein